MTLVMRRTIALALAAAGITTVLWAQTTALSYGQDTFPPTVDCYVSGAQIPGTKVAGKTGTAQTSADQHPYAWFVSFAPADDPEVAVAVLIEDAGVSRDAISGSGLAAPIAKRVMEAVMNQ